MKIRNSIVVCIIAALFATAPVGAVDKISLHALFQGKAIVLADGARRVLRLGETSPEGIKLVATDTQQETADVEIDGQRQQLRLGMVISSFAPVGKGTVTLYPEGGGHFFANGSINGAPVRFMVDTGATMIAMSSDTARRIGLDFKRSGRMGYANTAGGVTRTYYVKLDNVEVGDIKMFNVDAGVIEGSHPLEVLLGMSFLGSLDMKRDSEKLELRER